MNIPSFQDRQRAQTKTHRFKVIHFDLLWIHGILVAQLVVLVFILIET